MRIVIDTNVLISAFIGRGTSHKVLEHCIRAHTVVTSPFILGELRDKLTTRFHYSSEIADQAIALLQSRMETVTPPPLPAPICRDADDDNILAAALATQCVLIITGDKDLLVLAQTDGIQIVNPTTFAQSERIT